MGVLQFPSECNDKANSFTTMATRITAEQSMVSRVGVSRATKHIQLRILYIQDLVVYGTVRLKKVSTKDNLADLHTTCLPFERRRYLCELHHAFFRALLQGPVHHASAALR